MKTRVSAETGYRKISATLEAPVLKQIRERTTNVSGFLNDAAKRALYFERLRHASEELRRQGFERDERLYQGLRKWAGEIRARRNARSRKAR